MCDNNNIKQGGVYLFNTDIRNAAKAANIYLWQIADALGIADSSFSRRLRKELSKEEKDRILKIVKELEAKR